MRYVTVVRPYGPEIRTRVFALLERVGLTIRDEDVIPKGTSDARVVELLRARPPEVLLVPFHAHRDEHGEPVNGVVVAEQLSAALPALARVPILMPASTTALPGARLMLSPLGAKAVAPALAARILLLDEAALGSDATVAALLAHLRAAS